MNGEAPPFSRPLAVGRLPKGGVDQRLAATEPERLAAAAFLGIPSVELLEAELSVTPSRGGYRVVGEMRARAHQLCVATLEPFPVQFVEPVDARYAPPETLGPVSAKEIERGLEDEDPPEPLTGDAIDLGQLAVETLALALPPYPRKPGVAPVDVVIGDIGEPAESPFAALAALGSRKKPD